MMTSCEKQGSVDIIQSNLRNSMQFFFTFRKAKKILYATYETYQKRKKDLDQKTQKSIEALFKNLKKAIEEKDRETAKALSKELQVLTKTFFPKTSFQRSIEFFAGIAIALLIAIVIRQTWFELYRIPTGSMRPTLKESDFLLVSKTNYGLNIPLKTAHAYFDDDLVQRGDIVVFSGDQMDISDVDTMYFYLFPGKKQYVKRVIGKPGDTLYFYGGLIYGIDKDGTPLTTLHQNPIFQKIEHIPFIRFEEKVENMKQGVYPATLLYQMNKPVAKLSPSFHGGIQGKMLQHKIDDYFDLWGFKNFAMVKIVPKHFVPKEKQTDQQYYLQIKHHPSIHPPTFTQTSTQQFRPSLSYATSYLPLTKKHVTKIKEALFTARFHVQDGIAYRYGLSSKRIQSYPYFPKLDVANGTYEFDQGIAYKEVFQGQLKEMDKTNPIYSDDPEQIVTLFNCGIEFDTHYHSSSSLYPSRYAYFRDQELYLMGKPIFSKDDPELLAFVEKEKKSSHPFIDYGPPVNKDGSINGKTIQQYGLKIPEKMYLVLGDNHSLSADSRAFGFVPQKNIKGRVGFILWPISTRWAFPMQPFYSLLSAPTAFIWGFYIIILLLYYLWHKKKKRDLLDL